MSLSLYNEVLKTEGLEQDSVIQKIRVTPCKVIKNIE